MKRDDVFQMRIDQETHRKLIELAKLTERSKGAVVRYLINSAWSEFYKIPPGSPFVAASPTDTAERTA